MIFRYRDRLEKIASSYRYRWHTYWAWRPVRVEGCLVWLEWLERKRVADTDWFDRPNGLYCTQYRFPPEQEVT